MFRARIVAASLASSLALPSVSPAAPSAPCPSAGSDWSAARSLGACLDDADAAYGRGDLRASGAAYFAAVGHAGRAYESGRADPAFVKAAGSNLVYFGTERCGRAAELEPETRTALLGACIDLLQRHIDDLERRAAEASEQLASIRKILAPLLALRERHAPPPVTAPVPEPEPAPADPKPRPPVTAAPPTLTAAPPPTDNVGPSPAPRPKAIDVPVRGRTSRGLHAGLGVSISVSVLGAALLGASSAVGQSAKETIDTEMTDCAVESTSACSRRTTARNLYILGGVSLAAGLVSTAVFTALVIHQRRQPKRLTFTGDWSRRGATAGLLLRF